MKIKKNIGNQFENHANHENHRIPLENHENNENHRNPCENHKKI